LYSTLVLVEHRAHREVRRGRVVGVHEGQLEHLGAREQAGGVAVHGPDDVDHAVADLVEQLRRLAAEGHRRIDLDLDLAAGRFLDPLGPGREHLHLRRRFRRQEMVQLERDLLRPGAGR